MLLDFQFTSRTSHESNMAHMMCPIKYRHTLRLSNYCQTSFISWSNVADFYTHPLQLSEKNHFPASTGLNYTIQQQEAHLTTKAQQPTEHVQPLNDYHVSSTA